MADDLQLQYTINEIAAKIHDITYFDVFLKPEQAKSVYISNPIYYQGITDVLINYIRVLEQYIGNLDILENIITQVREIVCVCYCINFYISNIDISRSLKMISTEDEPEQKKITKVNYFIIQSRKIRSMLKKYIETHNISVSNINDKYSDLDINTIIQIPDETYYPDFVELDIFKRVNDIIDTVFENIELNINAFIDYVIDKLTILHYNHQINSSTMLQLKILSSLILNKLIHISGNNILNLNKVLVCYSETIIFSEFNAEIPPSKMESFSMALDHNHRRTAMYSKKIVECCINCIAKLDLQQERVISR